MREAIGVAITEAPRAAAALLLSLLFGCHRAPQAE